MSTRKLGKRSVIGLLGATLGTALGPACGPTPGASGATAPSSPRRAIGGTSAPLNAPAERLYLATQTGLSVVDAGSGKLDFAVPGAVPSPEGSRFVTCTHEGDTTHLRLIDAVDGSVRGAVSLHGRLSARVVSPRATRVALVEQDSAGPNPWTPAGRERTTLVVADPSGETPPRSYELEGNYEPEAFAADLRGLFVIQHLPALAPDRYRVRRFDLARGIPGPILTVKLTEVATEEEMRGKGRMQVFAPRLTTLYTLYTRQDDHLHTRDSIAAGGAGRPNPDVHAFVHVLNLEQGWAYCLDLPAPFGTGPSQSHAIGVAPNGRRLFVADCSTGWMATADPTSLQVGHVTRVREVAGAPQAAAGGHHAEHTATLEAGARTLYLGTGAEILALDGATLKLQQRWALEDAVRHLALSLDGTRLYAALQDRIAVLDALTGKPLGGFPAPEVSSVVRVTP